MSDVALRSTHAAERSELVRAALEMAREAHAGQIRNASGGRPYIDHPVAVAEQLVRARLLATRCWPRRCCTTWSRTASCEVEDMRERCGERVAEIVDALTDDESLEPYEERKREHRGRVEAAGADALAIYAADKLTNVEMLRDAYREPGRGRSATSSRCRST